MTQRSITDSFFLFNRPRRSPLRPIAPLIESSDPNSPIPKSPEEEVIEQRGPLRSSPRRRALQTSTPKINLLEKTSVDSALDTSLSSSADKTPGTRDKVTADGVRKRLVMSATSDEEDPTFTITKPSAKRRKTTKRNNNTVKVSSMRRQLSALTSEQLVQLLETLKDSHPELEEDIIRLIPAPDISSLIESLEHYRHNIFKSLPYSRWGSSRDAFCYRRVKTHVENFKNACINQGKQLQDSGSWEATIDYCLQASQSTDELPLWDNPAHNKSREMCLRSLAVQCKKAITSSHLDREKYKEILERLKEAQEINDNLEPCIALVQKKMR